MQTKQTLEVLEKLEAACQALRSGLRISKRGEMLFHAPRSMWSSSDVVVEADGKGGANLFVVEGNYPNDYFIKSQRHFDCEDAACATAEGMVR